MNRRHFFGLLAVLPALLRAKPKPQQKYGERLYGVVDFRADTATWGCFFLTRRARGGTVLVDGKEIRQVFYADTARGIVETYDLRGSHAPKELQDGKAHHQADFFRHASFGCGHLVLSRHGVCYQRLRGDVELYAPLHPVGWELGGVRSGSSARTVDSSTPLYHAKY